MTDWRELCDSWDRLSEEDRQLIQKLFKEKSKEKLADFFSREPYAKMVYEKAVGKWEPSTAGEPLEKKSTGMRRNDFRRFAAVLLPTASLTSLLLAEILYYNPSLSTFADKVLPLNLKAWIVLLALASSLGVLSILYTLKHVSRTWTTQESTHSPLEAL